MNEYLGDEMLQKLFESGGLVAFDRLPYARVDMHTIEGIPFPTTLIPPSTVYAMKTWEARPDDVFVVSYVKAGTTWTQEILSSICNNGDLEKMNKTHSFIRVPFLEASMVQSTKEILVPPMYEAVAKMKSPRVIKSHLPGHLMPPDVYEKKSRIVYVARNPKDVAVSYYYFSNTNPSMQAYTSWDEFFDEFYTGDVYCGPWWDHYLYFWTRRNDPNILFLKFEDMKRDLKGTVKQTAKFLGYSFTDDVIDAIVEHCTFANMKKNPMCNPDTFLKMFRKNSKEDDEVPFMRKGKVGDWKNHFTVAQNEAMDTLIEEKLAGSGLKFEY